VVDTGNRLINVPLTLAAEAEASGLGGFEGVAWSVCLYLFRHRLDLCDNWWRGIDPDCAKGQGFTGVPRGIDQCQFAVAVLTVAGEADGNFRLALIHMLQITTTVAGVNEAA